MEHDALVSFSSGPSIVPSSETKLYISNLLSQFINLNTLSINYNDLSEEFLNSAVSLISLKKLNLNVNSHNKKKTDFDDICKPP